MEKDKSYRFRLPNQLFEAARAKALREDLTLAQVGQFPETIRDIG